MLVLVETPRCLVCNNLGSVIVEDDDYAAWKAGTLIQNAMPYLNADSRELLMTGTHPECWDKMWE